MFQPVIRPAVENYLTSRPQRRIDDMLWVSDLGYHPANAMNRVIHKNTKNFPIEVLQKMENGTYIEDWIAEAVRVKYAGTYQSFPIFNAQWAGKIDLMVHHLTDEALIGEHKATSDKWWPRYIPNTNHCLQSWMYGQLYKEEYGIEPRCHLYYTGWGHWAEIQLTTNNKGNIIYNGLLDGEEWFGVVKVNAPALREELEMCHRQQVIPDIAEEDMNKWDYAEIHYKRPQSAETEVAF